MEEKNSNCWLTSGREWEKKCFNKKFIWKLAKWIFISLVKISFFCCYFQRASIKKSSENVFISDFFFMKYFFDGILNFYYLLFFQHEQWKTVAMMLLFCLSAKQQSTHKSEEKEEEITKNEERRRDSELLSDNWIKFKSLFQWLCCMEKQKTTSGCEKEIFFASFHLFRGEKFHPLFRNECFCFASVDGRVKINRMSMCLTQKMKKIKKKF